MAKPKKRNSEMEAIEQAREYLESAELALASAVEQLNPQLEPAARLLGALWQALGHLDTENVPATMNACASELLSSVNAIRKTPISDPYPKDRSAAAEALRARMVQILDEKPRVWVASWVNKGRMIAIPARDKKARLPIEEIALGLEVARIAHRATRALPAKPENRDARVKLWAEKITPILLDHEPSHAHDPKHPYGSRKIAERIIRACARASGAHRPDNLFVADGKRGKGKHGTKRGRPARTGAVT
jgi:hypothetical protein